MTFSFVAPENFPWDTYPDVNAVYDMRYQSCWRYYRNTWPNTLSGRTMWHSLEHYQSYWRVA